MAGLRVVALDDEHELPTGSRRLEWLLQAADIAAFPIVPERSPRREYRMRPLGRTNVRASRSTRQASGALASSPQAEARTTRTIKVGRRWSATGSRPDRGLGGC